MTDTMTKLPVSIEDIHEAKKCGQTIWTSDTANSVNVLNCENWWTSIFEIGKYAANWFV